MARPSEEIPQDEELYRGLKPDHVDGPRVLPEAIDLRGTSVVRAKYGSRTQAQAKADSIAVGAIKAGDFPGPTMSPDGVTAWEWFPLDLPEEADPAHAECRLRRVSDRPATENHKPGSASLKESLRKALADRFRVVTSSPR